MCAISEGLLYSWGKGIDGQLGHGNTKNMSRPQKIEGLSGVDSVSCGTNHTLVLTSTNDRNDVSLFINSAIKNLPSIRQRHLRPIRQRPKPKQLQSNKGKALKHLNDRSRR